MRRGCRSLVVLIALLLAGCAAPTPTPVPLTASTTPPPTAASTDQPTPTVITPLPTATPLPTPTAATVETLSQQPQPVQHIIWRGKDSVQVITGADFTPGVQVITVEAGTEELVLDLPNVNSGSVWLSPDQQRVAVWQRGVAETGRVPVNTVRIYDLTTGRVFFTLGNITTGADIAWSPDGSTIAVGTVRGVLLWRGAAYLGVLEASIPINRGEYYVPTWSPDGAWMAAVTEQFGGRAEVVVWDAARRSQQDQIVIPGTAPAENLAWSADNTLMLITAESAQWIAFEEERITATYPQPGKYRVFDAAWAGEQAAVLLQYHNQPTPALVVWEGRSTYLPLPEGATGPLAWRGDQVMVAGQDGTLYVITPAAGSIEEVRTPIRAPITALAPFDGGTAVGTAAGGVLIVYH